MKRWEEALLPSGAGTARQVVGGWGWRCRGVSFHGVAMGAAGGADAAPRGSATRTNRAFAVAASMGQGCNCMPGCRPVMAPAGSSSTWAAPGAARLQRQGARASAWRVMGPWAAGEVMRNQRGGGAAGARGVAGIPGRRGARVGAAHQADEAGPEALGLANAQQGRQGRQGPWGRWLAAHHNPVLMNFIAIGNSSTMKVQGKMKAISGRSILTGASMASFS